MTKKKNENYLDKIPMHKPNLKWDKENDGTVCLHIENKGVFNRIAQLLFKKPKVSHIHLDEIGSFLWCEIDAKRSLAELSAPFGEHFGEKVEPKYERLCSFIELLKEYGFIEFTENTEI